MKERKVLIAKPGLDGHDRGAKVVAMALRNAGIEVVYTGLRRLPEEIVSMALGEDVDIIGLSILSGAHLSLTKAVMESLRNSGCEIPVIVGGIISEEDTPALKEMGVVEVFPTGSVLGDIVDYIKRMLENKKQQESG